jgi:hypothetical protein
MRFSLRMPSALKCSSRKIRAADMLYKRAGVERGHERGYTHEPGWMSAKCMGNKHWGCAAVRCECACHAKES